MAWWPFQFGMVMILDIAANILEILRESYLDKIGGVQSRSPRYGNIVRLANNLALKLRDGRAWPSAWLISPPAILRLLSRPL
jgi:hypothetical protein